MGNKKGKRKWGNAVGIDSLIDRVVTLLKEVHGIDAVVLGGSRARGDFRADSDIDIGIYYSDGDSLDLEKLTEAAAHLDDEQRANLVTSLGEWGPWINGGGWLVVDGIHLDFLLRDLGKVQRVIDDCRRGIVSIDYQPGHPHGFVNAIYMAEVHFCKVLWDPRGFVAGLKENTVPYPAELKKGIIDKFLWEAEFSLHIVKSGLSKGDMAYTAGGVYRSIACLVQVLYALNETYVMNEKGAVLRTENFTRTPRNFAGRVDEIFGLLALHAEKRYEALEKLEALVREVKQLVCDRL